MIRYLKPGERVPDGPPRRYLNVQGYMRLRWRVGKGEYVETLEHRVTEDGHVTTAPQVHHRNEDPADNRPENLMPGTAAEHKAEHRKIDRDEAVRRYRAGESILTIGRALDCDPSNLSRVLRAEGVQMRHPSEYGEPIPKDFDQVAAMPGARDRSLAAYYGVGRLVVRRWRRIVGLPAYPNGRPTAAERAEFAQYVHAHPSWAYEAGYLLRTPPSEGSGA